MSCGPRYGSTDVQTQIDSMKNFLTDTAESALDNIEPIVYDPDNLPDFSELDYVSPDINAISLSSSPPEIPPGSLADITMDDIDTDVSPINPFQKPTKPSFTVGRPTLYLPDNPDDLDSTAPDTKPTLDAIVIPSAPVPDVIPDPIQHTIVLPTYTELSIPVFEFTVPEDNLEYSTASFDWVEDPYASELFNHTKSEILRMQEGNTGLTDAIWQQIIDKAATRTEAEKYKLIEEVTNESARKGWGLIQGITLARIDIALQAASDQRAEFIRNTQVEQAKLEIENLKFSIAQGIAFETMAIALHNAVQDRSLKAAELTVILSVELLKAHVAIYNAKVQGYIGYAQAYKYQIEAELFKLEEYKAKLEGQKLIGDLNEQELKIYLAKLEGVQKEIDIFVAQLEGVKATADINKTKMEVYRTEVQAYAEEVGAWGAEWNAVKIASDAQSNKVNLYQAEVQAFAERMRGYGIEVEAEKASVDVSIETAKIDLGKIDALTRNAIAKVEAQAATIRAQASIYSSQTDAYKGRIAYDSVKIQALGQQQEAEIANAKAEAEIAIQKAKMASDAILANAQVAVQAQATNAQVQAQVAAGSLSGMNFNVTNGKSYSETSGNSWSRTYDCN